MFRRLLKALFQRSEKEPDPPLGWYKLLFVSAREPVEFQVENDEQALRRMCREMHICYPPRIVDFRSRAGSGLYRLQPAEQIFPKEEVRVPIARAGVATSFSEERRQIQVPMPVQNS